MQEYVNPAHVCTWSHTQSYTVVPAGRGRFHKQANTYSVEDETKISVSVLLSSYVSAPMVQSTPSSHVCQTLSNPAVDWETLHPFRSQQKR